MDYLPAICATPPAATYAAMTMPWMGMGAKATQMSTAFASSPILQQERHLLCAPGAKSFTTLWAEPEIISEPLFLYGDLASVNNPQRLEFAQNVAKRLEHEEEGMRIATCWELVRILPHLDTSDRTEFAFKVAQRFEDAVEKVRTYAVHALASILQHLNNTDRLDVALKIADKLKLDDKWLRSTAFFSITSIIRHLDEHARIELLQKVAELLDHKNEEVRELAVHTHGRAITYFDDPTRLSFALKIKDKLKDGSENVRIAATWELAEFAIHLPAPMRHGFALEIEKMFEDGDEGVRKSAVGALGKIIPYLDSSARLEFAFKLAQMIGDGNQWVSFDAIKTLEQIVQHLDRPARFELAKKVADMLSKCDSKLYENLVQRFVQILQQLALRGRLAMLRELIAKRGLDGLCMLTMNLLCQRIPDDVLLKFARRHGGDIATLVDYAITGIPFDSYFWKAYLNAVDKAAYLARISADIDEYRRGKRILRWTERKLHLAYAGLDSPGGLSFEDFKREIQMAIPPPPFLDEPFTEDVKQAQSIHSQMDKGKLIDALKPMEFVQNPDSFSQYVSRLVSENKNELKTIRPYLDEAFPQGMERLDIDKIVSAAPTLLENIWSMKSSSLVQELILALGFMLAWNHKGIENLKEHMLAVYGKKAVSSDSLYKGFVATYEFYTGKLEDVLPGKGDRIRPIRLQRRVLAAEIARMPKESGERTTVEFIPSKSQADQFIGYMCEDCTKESKAILRDDFQIYRMISNRRPVGALYVQKAVLDEKNALVIVIQPRLFWTVDHSDLLEVIERRIGQAAKANGYDYALLMAKDAQQSNRPDMKAAIAERNYRPISFSEPISGWLLSGNEFLVMWEKE